MREGVKFGEFINPEISGRKLNLVFILLFIGVSLFYNYQNIVSKRPTSVHVWRQTDCTSMALNYHQHDLPLLHPQMHYRFNEKAEALGEFPIMYWLVGKLYGVFGYHEFIYRFLWFLMAFIGSFCLFRLSWELTGLGIESLFIGLALINSPVVAFYAVSFIPDPVALFMSIVSIYLFYRAYRHKSFLQFALAVLAATLAGLLKISALLLPLSMLGTYLLYCLFKRQIKEGSMVLLAILFLLVINYVWYAFIIEFNAANNTGYFFTRTAPIWDMSAEERSNVTDILWNQRFREFYSKIFVLFSVVLLIPGLFRLKNGLWYSLFSGLIFIGISTFLLLFYSQFKYHDYYMINTTFFLPFYLMIGFLGLKNWRLHKYLVVAIKVVFVVLVIRNVDFSRHTLNGRFNQPENAFYNEKGYEDLDAYLLEIGVERKDYVISIPDVSPNVTLYLMNRSGWTNLYHNPMREDNITYFKSQGAKYLVVGDERLLEDEEIKGFLHNKIGQYQGISIYKL